MITGFQIRAGRVSEIRKAASDWLFVDLGFKTSGRSCGVLKPDGNTDVYSFGDLKEMVIGEAQKPSPKPLSLVLEAPLSVAFNPEGNPTRRVCDTLRNENNEPIRRGNSPQTRDWWHGPGTSMMVAATYLLRAVLEGGISRDIRLFEGFVSFKPAGTKSNHIEDVQKLREVAFGPNYAIGKIFGPDQLRQFDSDKLESAFKVASMDFGVPPVIFVNP